MATSMETILSNLLVPDSAVIQQATQQLKLVCRDPAIILQLCQVLTSANDPQIRQYGAFIIRRRITKNKQWTNLPDEFKQHLRSNILHAVIQESDESIRDALVQIVATVAKHERSGGWAELFAFLDEFTKSADATKRELGLHVLSQVAYVANVQLKPHLLGLSQLFEQVFLDDEKRMCQYYAVLTMSHLVYQIGTDEQDRFQLLIMPLLQAIRGLISEDEEKACKALGIFNKLMESKVAVIVPHIKAVVEFCLEIAANQNLGDEIRVKAMSFITRLTKRKSNSILEHELVEPVLEVMFTIMSVPHGEDETNDESSNPYSYARGVVKIMVFYLPPQTIISKMMSFIERALRSSDPHRKKAGYMALDVTVFGWQTIRVEYMDACVQWLSSGVKDPNPIVHNSAILALAQFSVHLRPDIRKFSDEFILMLLNYLRESHTSDDTDSSLSKTYHALSSFFKYMGEEILPYLAPLMEQLLSGLRENNRPMIRELSIKVIGLIANQITRKDLVPYFQSIMEHLKPLLNSNYLQEFLPLQLQVFYTLLVLQRILGKEHLVPFAHEYIQLGIQVMTGTKDPHLKRYFYAQMASLIILFKCHKSEFLQPIVDQMVESLKSNKDVTTHFNEQQENWLKLFDVEDLGTDDMESDDEIYEIQSNFLEDAYVEEKKAACFHLGEIAFECEQAFMPYIERVYEEMVKLLDHPASKVRQVSGYACAQLCACLARSGRNGIQDSTSLLSRVIFHLLPRLLACIREDVDRNVISFTLLAVKILLDEVKEPVLANPEHLPAICHCIRCVLCKKTVYQDAVDDPEADNDRFIIEQAIDLIPALIITQNSQNSIFLVTACLPDLVKRLEHNSMRDRSFTIRTIAEIMDALGDQTEIFVEKLYSVIMHALRDIVDEVRSTAIFAVGVLAKNGGQKILTKYDEISMVLLSILVTEHDNLCKDYICGTLCQMLLKCPQSLPVDQIVPVVLRNLPLSVIFYMNSTIFECLNSLYAAEQKDVVQNLSQILSLIGGILVNCEYTDDCQDHMAHLVKRAAENQPDVVTSTLALLNGKQKQMLEACLNL